LRKTPCPSYCHKEKAGFVTYTFLKCATARLIHYFKITNGNGERDLLRLLRHPHAKTRYDPQYAHGSKHEPRSEYEREIEYSGFQNLHDGLFATLFSIVMQQEKKEVKIQQFRKVYVTNPAFSLWQ
jgi:hypothetical protein